MPSPEMMQAAVHAYVHALNAADLDAIVALYSEDAVVEDPVGSAPQRGLPQIRAFYAASLRLKLEVELDGQIRTADCEAAFAFHVAFEVGGQLITISPIDTFRFDDAGRIVEMRAYFGSGNKRSRPLNQA